MGPYLQTAAGVAVLCLAALFLAPTDSAPVSAAGQTAATEDEETQLALDEVGRLFRRLFPLVPDKAQYFWKSSHLGGTLVLRNHEQRSRPPLDEETQEPSDTDIRLGTSPWRLEVQFRKRGPDCMRKCIAQGVLHPVQCHSLC